MITRAHMPFPTSDVMFEFGRQLRKHECFRKVELGLRTKLLELNS